MASEEAAASMVDNLPPPPEIQVPTTSTHTRTHTLHHNGLEEEEEIVFEKIHRINTSPRPRSSLYSFVVGKQSPLDTYDTWSDAGSGGTGTPSEDEDGDEEPNWALNAQHQQQIEQFLRVQLRNQRIIVGLTLVISVVFVVVILHQSGRQYGGHKARPNRPFNYPFGTTTVLPPPDPLEVFVRSLSNETQQSLLEPNSPSNRSLEWLSSLDDEILENWRIPQLFALGTLYYTLDGPHWPYNYVQWMLRNPRATAKEWYDHQQPFCGQYCQDTDMDITHMQLPEGWHYIRRTLQAKSPYEARVTSLDLTGLDFSHTTISTRQQDNDDGSIRIPAEIFLWTSLQELKMGGSLNDGLLSNATLGSLLPLSTSFSGRLSSLSIMNGCGREGAIPTELGLWTVLSKVHLEGNQLIGKIPLELGQLTLLRELSLDHNSLRGTLPRELALELHNLRSLRASDNDLIGGIPSEYFGMFALQLIDLSHNNLSGTLPANVRSKMRRSQLKVLRLQNNSLTGQIPNELLLTRRLEQIDLSHNNLDGQIPTYAGLLSSATHINLSHNRLVGSLPSELGLLAVTSRSSSSSSSSSNFGGSPFDGQPWRGDPAKVKRATETSSNIVELDFSYNNLTGSIPAELSILVELGLKILNLTGNPGLTGTVPKPICLLNLPNCSHVSGSPGQCFLGLDCIPGQICGCSDCPCPPASTVVASTTLQPTDDTIYSPMKIINQTSLDSNSTTNDTNDISGLLEDQEYSSDQDLYSDMDNEMSPTQNPKGNIFAKPTTIQPP